MYQVCQDLWNEHQVLIWNCQNTVSGIDSGGVLIRENYGISSFWYKEITFLRAGNVLCLSTLSLVVRKLRNMGSIPYTSGVYWQERDWNERRTEYCLRDQRSINSLLSYIMPYWPSKMALKHRICRSVSDVFLMEAALTVGVATWLVRVSLMTVVCSL